MKLLLVGSAVASLGLAALAGNAVGDNPAQSILAAATTSPEARPARIVFAVADSRAAKRPDAVIVANGLTVTSATGAEIGTVDRMILKKDGRVTSFLVNMGDTSAMMPARHFKPNDGKLTSAMDEAAIRKEITKPYDPGPPLPISPEPEIQ